MLAELDEEERRHYASMGPRSDNRGYVNGVIGDLCKVMMLQWVHGPITVVMATRPGGCGLG